MKFGLSPLQSGGDFDATIAECERAEAASFGMARRAPQQLLLPRMSVAGIPADAARASMDLFTHEVIPALKGA